MKSKVLGALFVYSLAVSGAHAQASELPPFDPRWSSEDAGCSALSLVSTGAEFPQGEDTLAVRWTGYANFELAYNGHVLLLDAYIDRGSAFMPLGVAAGDIENIDAILIGHGHSDHMSDAVSIAQRTGAPVVGAPVTAEALAAQGLADDQIVAVSGTEPQELQYGPFRIRPILGIHGSPPSDVVQHFRDALAATTEPYTDEEASERAEISARGTSDPRVRDEGTIAYLITLDNGFRIMFRDTGGRVSDYERAAMQDVGGRVDLGLVAVAAAYLNTLTVEQAMEHIDTYRPSIYIPAHRDGDRRNLWRPVAPLIQAAKDKYPDIVAVAPTYREPVCIDTAVNLSAAG